MPRPRPDDIVLAAMPTKRPGITKRGLERKLGMTRQTIWRVVHRLHDEKRCHICGWMALKGGGPFQPRYAAGEGVDAECTLKPIPAMEAQRRFKEKAKLDGRWDLRNKKLREKYARDKARPSLWFAALRF